MKVLVCGSRGFGSPTTIRQRIYALPEDTTVIHGGARGADTQAGIYAARAGFKVLVFKADWKRHHGGAGRIRNREMLNQQPDLVIAFWDGSSKGTKDTIDEAKRRGIPVEVIRQP